MVSINSEDGGASFAAVLGIGALMAFFVINENKATNLMQKRVLGENLIGLAKETNESALSRTRSLLLTDGSIMPALKILPGGEFQKLAGSGFQVTGGRLNLSTPLPPARDWSQTSGTNITQLGTQLKIDEVTVDSAGNAASVVVSATTTTHQADLSKTITTKARFNLLALNSPPALPATGVASVPSVPSSAVPIPSAVPSPARPPSAPAAVASNQPVDPCSGSATTASNGPGAGINNTEGGVGIGNTGGGIGIGNVGGIGIGNTGGIGIGSQCGGIGINAPPGCIGIGMGGDTCLGVRR